MAIHSSILTWRIPGTEELGGLQSMGLQGVRHEWATNTFIFTLSMCISLPLSFPHRVLFIRSSYLLSFFLLIQKLKNMYVYLFWMLTIYWSHALQRYCSHLWLELKTPIFTIHNHNVNTHGNYTQFKKDKVASSRNPCHPFLIMFTILLLHGITVWILIYHILPSLYSLAIYIDIPKHCKLVLLTLKFMQLK